MQNVKQTQRAITLNRIAKVILLGGIIFVFTHYHNQGPIWVEVIIIGALLTVIAVNIATINRLMQINKSGLKFEFQNQLLKAQNEASFDGILVVSTGGKIISFNNRFVDLWGIPKEIAASDNDEEAINSVLSKLVNPEQFVERIKQLYANPEETSLDVISLQDGRVFERYSSPIKGPDGILYGRIWFFRDISERIEAEMRITEQQQLIVQASKMSALGEMAGGVAHEINTPLCIIGMRVEQIKRLAADENFDRPRFNEALVAIEKTTERIARIINGLRFFAQDAKRTPNQTTSVNSIIEDTLSFCRERFKNHGVMLEYFKPDNSPSVDCRAVEISQVLLNLLNNSFDAIEHFDEKWVRVEIADLGSSVEIIVTDSGKGIPRDISNKVMVPFFTTKDIGKGTGLGLSISKGIVESHNGELKIDSNHPNTRFIMTLPKAYSGKAPSLDRAS